MNILLVAFLLCSTLLLFTLACRRTPTLAGPLLLAASLIFYLMENPLGLPLLLASILFNFLVAGRIVNSPAHGRRWMIFGVVVNLLPLVFYKYLHHPASADEPSSLMVVFGNIPLGLSFYSFQQISCLVDLQQKRAARLNLLHHALFTSFFAQIPAGPISQYRMLAPQIAAIGTKRVAALQLANGLSLFTLGLGKKLILAGLLSRPVDQFYISVGDGSKLPFLQAWETAWMFLLQLYFDFSGYTDMALGAAMCFGLELPPNFNSPLKSISGTEFVDRWHMSLVSWIREYLYGPVLHFVVKLPFGSSASRRVVGWAVATIISMAVIGIWHGSQAIFVILGTFAGVLLVVRQLLSTGSWSRRQSKPSAARVLVSRLVHLAGLCVLVVPMRARTTATGFAVIRSMLVPHRATGLLHAGVGDFDKAVLLIATAIVFALPNTMQIFHLLPGTQARGGVRAPIRLDWRPSPYWGVLIGTILTLALYFSHTTHQSGFIYAQF